MVRCLGILLILAMLLCGCAQNTTEPTPTDTTTDTGVVENTGLYIPGSDIEIATDGAVRDFQLDDGVYYGCVTLGQDLVLMRQKDGNGTFTLYHGENLEKISSLDLGQSVAPGVSQVHPTSQGISYFDENAKAMVFLSKNLVETGRMYLPENILGSAWPAPDWTVVYYCTEQGIHTMDLQTGISRVLLQQTAFHQEITGVLGDGSVLRYDMELTEGQHKTVLLDSATGVTLQEGDYLSGVITRQEQYFLPQTIKGVRFLRVGNGQTHQVLWPMETSSRPVMLFDNNAMVMAEENEQGTILAYYDLDTGMRTASVDLDSVSKVTNLQGDGESGVWMFVQEADQIRLFHWDTTKTPTEDTEVYTEPMYTYDQPNEDGLAQIAKDAADLGSQFGVDILTWKDAVANAPDYQVLSGEFSVQLYEHYLPRLKTALSVFPEGFFTKDPKVKLRIALVGKIEGDPENGTLPESNCLQFWDEKTPVVVLTLGEDFEFNLYVHVLIKYDCIANGEVACESYDFAILGVGKGCRKLCRRRYHRHIRGGNVHTALNKTDILGCG